ncbi:MAG: hypothetical protein ABWY22_13485 [Flavobacterium sp.]
MTSVYIIIGGKYIVEDVAHSDPHENGNIDLDQNGTLLWKDLGLANTYVGNQLVYMTTIYGLPTTTTDDNVKEFVLENNPIDYKLKQANDVPAFHLNDNDKIILNSPRIAIAYKLIHIS